MENMFIMPMTMAEGIGGLSELQAAGARRNVTGAAGESLFQGIFESAINNVKEAEQELSEKQYLLATGQIDDAHTVPIASAEAALTVDVLVQMRNKALESYNALINMSI